MPGAQIALVAANEDDGMQLMIERPNGLIALVYCDERLKRRYRLRELHFVSGAPSDGSTVDAEARSAISMLLWRRAF